MIPKTIHYCWFGPNEKPSLVLRCIDSWVKKCPDYKLIEWNEKTIDLSKNTYAHEALAAKQWAFVADYARLLIIYKYGGIYLDTDVELLRPLDDLLNNKAFLALEDSGKIATGLGFGAEVGNPIIYKMLQGYDCVHFLLPNGNYDLLPCPVRNTESIEELLPKHFDLNRITRIQDATIYPREYFCPLSADGATMKKSKRTYSIHWFTALWLSPEDKIIHDYHIFRNRCERILGRRFGRLVTRVFYLLYPNKREILKKND